MRARLYRLSCEDKLDASCIRVKYNSTFRMGSKQIHDTGYTHFTMPARNIRGDAHAASFHASHWRALINDANDF